MRLSEFWALADAAFGSASARTLVADLVLGALGERTVAQALEDGVPPAEAWSALCDAMDVPPDRRWSDPRRRRPGRSA